LGSGESSEERPDRGTDVRDVVALIGLATQNALDAHARLTVIRILQRLTAVATTPRTAV
jgi:hypothetical protein